MYPVGRHAVCRCYGAQRNAAFVGTFVAHDAHALYRQQHNSRLPYLVVEVGLVEHVDEDLVGLLEHGDLLGRDLAQNTYSETRAGEGVAAYEQRADAERTAHAAHLILEEQAQGLDDLQVHVFGQAAHVVVRLDLGGGAVDRSRLHDVGIYRPLSQPLDILYALGLLVEYLDEVAAYDLAFLLGVGHARQIAQKTVCGAHALDIEAHALV